MVKKKTTPKQKAEDANKEEEMKAIEQSITELREKSKQDPDSVDYPAELRRIQDQISDIRGVERRPVTAKPDGRHDDDDEEDDDDKKEENNDTDEEEEEEEKEEEDPDAEIKELINKRLTTCMLLALSFEEDYPKDFYEKLNESKKADDVVAPITRDELKELNRLLKERKGDALRRVKECSEKEPANKSKKPKSKKNTKKQK